MLVETKLLSRQKRVCGDRHVFVETKMTLVVAPANDREAGDAEQPLGDSMSLWGSHVITSGYASHLHFILSETKREY